MALSDTCSEVTWQLASDIVHYLDWGYGIEDISNLVDVVFSLASFQAKHDAPFMNAQEQKNGIDRMVISMFKDFVFAFRRVRPGRRYASAGFEPATKGL